MDIGEQQRVIIVEPLIVPDEFPIEEPVPVPQEMPEPEKVPARNGVAVRP
ncbi:MAG: hypothetical protein HZA58_10695 [Acidimicrobiia bacterium]|nr:hypothetical protein [Acidimicrobiia bacterium]